MPDDAKLPTPTEADCATAKRISLDYANKYCELFAKNEIAQALAAVRQEGIAERDRLAEHVRTLREACERVLTREGIESVEKKAWHSVEDQIRAALDATD